MGCVALSLFFFRVSGEKKNAQKHTRGAHLAEPFLGGLAFLGPHGVHREADGRDGGQSQHREDGVEQGIIPRRLGGVGRNFLRGQLAERGAENSSAGSEHFFLFSWFFFFGLEGEFSSTLFFGGEQ